MQQKAKFHSTLRVIQYERRSDGVNNSVGEFLGFRWNNTASLLTTFIFTLSLDLSELL